MNTAAPSADRVWVCLPAYNEASQLGRVIDDIRRAGLSNVCVVDDGSHDDTAEVARRHGALTLVHPINRGAGAAVMTAFTLARRRGWDYVALLDADGQHLPTDLNALIGRMRETDADLVIGSRFLGRNDDIPASRRHLNRLANWLTNLTCRSRYTDTQSGMRLLNARALAAIELESNGFGFCSEMLLRAERAGLRVTETPISVRYTDYSISKGQDLQIGFRTALSFLWNFVFR